MAIYQQLKNGNGETAAKEHVTMFLGYVFAHSTSVRRLDLTRSDTSNLLDIESLMARRLRIGKRERILLALKCGKIAKEVKTLTAKLEESYRNFMVWT